MSFKLIAMLLREFDYEKNGKDASVRFLISMINELVNGKESDE